MRDPLYNHDATKQTVSVTLNSDLYAKSRNAGINVSKVAEKAVADAYQELQRAKLLVEIQQDLDAVQKYVDEHGSLADLLRAHDEQKDGAV
jgi:post-segregation antitoxin (ccd killing protein)